MTAKEYWPFVKAGGAYLFTEDIYSPATSGLRLHARMPHQEGCHKLPSIGIYHVFTKTNRRGMSGHPKVHATALHLHALENTALTAWHANAREPSEWGILFSSTVQTP